MTQALLAYANKPCKILGRSPSQIAYSRALKTGIIFLIMDIVSFFDKENIFDCLETMDRLGVNQKAARVWYKLNKDTQVAVKTTCGMTETAEVGDCLGQGTAGAGLVLQANLDHGLNSYFQGCKEVMYYGETRIQPLSYQDDVGAPCLDVSMARVQASLLASPDKTRQDWIPDPRCKELHRKNKK